jgi:hypothetical protein
VALSSRVDGSGAIRCGVTRSLLSPDTGGPSYPVAGSVVTTAAASVVATGSDGGGVELAGADADGLGVREVRGITDAVSAAMGCFLAFFGSWLPGLSVLRETDASTGAVAPESAVVGDPCFFGLL